MRGGLSEGSAAWGGYPSGRLIPPHRGWQFLSACARWESSALHPAGPCLGQDWLGWGRVSFRTYDIIIIRVVCGLAPPVCAVPRRAPTLGDTHQQLEQLDLGVATQVSASAAWLGVGGLRRRPVKHWPVPMRLANSELGFMGGLRPPRVPSSLGAESVEQGWSCGLMGISLIDCLCSSEW